jgi:hypothetical protein
MFTMTTLLMISVAISMALSVTACISMPEVTAKGTAALAPKAEIALRRGQSYESFKMGAPAGLQMLEASLIASPNNPHILAALAKGYNAYATIVGDTEILLSGEQGTERAIVWTVDHHTLAVSRAKQFLEHVGIQWTKDATALTEHLQRRSGDQDVVDIAFVAAHSLKSLAALQRSKPATLTYIPIADALSQFACGEKNKPSYPTWACEGMNAIELAEKPSVAGGNLQKSQNIFRDIHHREPHSLMPMALWSQFILSKKFDREAWALVKETIAQYKLNLLNRQLAIATSEHGLIDDDNALLNAAAARRIEYMAAHEKDFF